MAAGGPAAVIVSGLKGGKLALVERQSSPAEELHDSTDKGATRLYTGEQSVERIRLAPAPRPGGRRTSHLCAQDIRGQTNSSSQLSWPLHLQAVRLGNCVAQLS